MSLPEDPLGLKLWAVSARMITASHTASSFSEAKFPEEVFSPVYPSVLISIVFTVRGTLQVKLSARSKPVVR